MINDYQTFIDRVIQRYEGGYCWDRGDPGGPTKYGITCYDLAEHRHQKMSSMSDWVEPVKNMPLADAEEIYKTKYAMGIRFNDLPAGPDCCMLDYAINSGVSRSIKVARAIVGLNSTSMDALTTAILHYDPKQFVDSMCKERLAFMHAIRGGSAWAQFGRGWGARVADLQVYCDHLITGTSPHPGPGPDLSKVPTPKAKHVPINKTTTTAGSATGGAVVIGGAAHAAGFPWEVVAGIVAVVGIGAIAYEVWQKHRANVANEMIHLPIQGATK